MATTSIPPLTALLPLSSSPNPKFHRSKHSPLPFAFSLSLPAPNWSKKAIHFQNPSQKNRKGSHIWTNYATSGDILPADSTALENSKEIVSATAGVDERMATIISGLLFIAFVALAILTIGVVYIGINDFLQKREKDKFEKDTAEKKKSGGKKKKVATRAKGGPRGFGQKIDEFEDEDYD